MQDMKYIEAAAPDLTFDLPNGTTVVKLGLIITLYFKDGYSSQIKRRIVECFTRFNQEFGHHLKAQVDGRYKKLTEQGFRNVAEKVTSSDPNYQFEWHITSAASAFESADLSLSVMNSPEMHGDRKRSYIKLVLPWSSLKETGGTERFQEWVAYLCNQVRAEHGYGGFSSILPYDFDKYLPMEFQLAQQYTGLEVDSYVVSFKRELLGVIKGINWYTVLGNELVNKLGGAEHLRQILSQTAYKIEDYDDGVFIRAGVLPDLGHGHLPQAYIEINRILKSLQIAKPDQLHSYSPYGNTFDEESSARWYARFDEAEEATRSPRRLAAGEQCSVAGFWYSPANNNVRRRFKQGEVMPEFKGSSWGATFWYWSGEE